MSKLPRINPAFSAAVAMGLLMATALFAAKPDPAPPAAPPADAITAADVRKLQDTIKGLHERFEDQGKILRQNSDDLGTLTKRVDDYLKPSTLEPVKTGLAAVVNKINNLQEAVGRQAETQEKQTAGTAAELRAVSAAIGRLQEQLDKSGQTAEASMAQLRKDLAASRAPALPMATASDQPVSLLPLLVSIAIATVILGVIIVLNGRAQRRALDQTQTQLTAALTQVRESLLTEIPSRQPAGSGTATGTTDSLAEIRAKLHSVLEHLNPSAPPVQSDDHTTQGFSRTPPDEHATIHLPNPAGPGIPSSACWPAAFLDPASPLCSWRERIEGHLASSEHPALPVFSAFLSLRTLCARQPAPSLTEVGAAVIVLSQALYAYWESLPGLSDDDRAHASSVWMQAVKSLIASVAPKLEIREIIAGARFDSDSMQTVHEGSGNHLSVAAVYSWAILDRSGERVKVLQRARIATN
jgi:hypothetical protein